jgi:serine/threonine-protein phosphatase 5
MEVEKSKELAETYKAEGNSYFEKKTYIPAAEAYQKGIEACPTTEVQLLVVLHANSAAANLKMENFGLTISSANTAIELDPNYPKSYYRRAEANMVLEHFAEALKDFKKVVELCPKDKGARDKYNACLKAKKENAFLKAIESDRGVPKSKSIDVNSMIVEDSYVGPHLQDGVVTLDFVEQIQEHFKNQKVLHKKYAMQILIQAKALFNSYPTLVDIPLEDGAHINVCGDTHGQFYDLLNLFSINGNPSDKNPYLFNGDYVDRGSFSCEVLFTLLAYKILYPNNFFMSRGNHETTSMNKMYGFSGEIIKKYSSDHYEVSQELFCEIPLAHVIFNKVFVVHGGLSTTPGFSLDMIRKEKRNREPPESGVMADLLWADPQVMPGRSPSKRGVGYSFGPNYTEEFLQSNGLELVIRSHEVKTKGYQYEHNKKLITVFSAPNYCDQIGNEGAWVTVTRKGDSIEHKCTSFKHVPHPSIPPMAYASGLFGL